MLRLKANKTSLYNLVATYKPLPGMRRVDFQKANGRPDYWLEWTTDDGHTKAFLSSSLGHPILTITTHDAAGGQLYHEDVYKRQGRVRHCNACLLPAF